MPGQPERRRNDRTRVDRLVYVQLPSDNGGIVKDISEGGLGFCAVAPLDGSAPIPVLIRLPGTDGPKRVPVTSNLVWTDGTRKSGGLRFTELPDDSFKEIRAWQFEGKARTEPAEPSSIARAEVAPATAEVPASTPTPNCTALAAPELAEDDPSRPIDLPPDPTRPPADPPHPIDPPSDPPRPVDSPADPPTPSDPPAGPPSPIRAPAVVKVRAGTLPPGVAVLPTPELTADYSPRAPQSPATPVTAVKPTTGKRRQTVLVACAAILGIVIGFKSNTWYREMHRRLSAAQSQVQEAARAPSPSQVSEVAFASSVVAQDDAPEQTPGQSPDLRPESGSARIDGAQPGEPQVAVRLVHPDPEDAFLFVQVGSYWEEAEVQNLVERLRGQSFAAYATELGDTKLYRVQLGPYTTGEAADTDQQALQNAGFDSWVRESDRSN